MKLSSAPPILKLGAPLWHFKNSSDLVYLPFPNSLCALSYAVLNFELVHPNNHNLCTCMAFPQNEREDAFSDFLLGQMTSRTLYSDMPSHQCGWPDVVADAVF